MKEILATACPSCDAKAGERCSDGSVFVRDTAFVEHRLLRVLWCPVSGDKARYQCSCGHDGPWCRGAPSGTHDRRTFKSAETEARELHACHVEIEQRAARDSSKETDVGR